MGRKVAKSTLLAGVAAAAVAAAAGYMVFEAQWVRCRRLDLSVPGLPLALRGLSVLHLSDVHAGLFYTNERALAKVVEWALPLAPDLVFLTGDILGEPARSVRSLELITRLRPPLGTFAVTGNHEYGLSKGPLARARHSEALWAAAGITLLQDRCTVLRPVPEARLAICGADYLTGGLSLVEQMRERRSETVPGDVFPMLLMHEPPSPSDPLANYFALAFAGHTHGGQIRVPGPGGLVPVNGERDTRLSGVHDWGRGSLVISAGIGASFLPMRLFTRPEATLWRLV